MTSGVTTVWLIEYAESQPCPIYVPADFVKANGFFTCDPWAARRFETKEAAEAWMANPDGNAPYRAPWQAVQHGFAPPFEEWITS